MVRGERRTYTLAPQSLTVEIVGGLRIINPNDVGKPEADQESWFTMSRRLLHEDRGQPLRALRDRRRQRRPARPARAPDRPVHHPDGQEEPGRQQRDPGHRRPVRAGDLRGRPERQRRPERHHRPVRVPRPRPGDVQHDARGAGLRGPGELPQRPPERLPGAGQDLRVDAGRRRPERRGPVLDRRLLRLGADRGLDQALQHDHAGRLLLLHRRRRRQRRAEGPHRGRRGHADHRPRLTLGLARHGLLRRLQRPRPAGHRPRHAVAAGRRLDPGHPLRRAGAAGVQHQQYRLHRRRRS